MFQFLHHCGVGAHIDNAEAFPGDSLHVVVPYPGGDIVGSIFLSTIDNDGVPAGFGGADSRTSFNRAGGDTGYSIADIINVGPVPAHKRHNTVSGTGTKVLLLHGGKDPLGC